MKIVVHTKTGHKLAYYPTEFGKVSDARRWWMTNLAGKRETIDSVGFGIFCCRADQIDFVEILEG